MDKKASLIVAAALLAMMALAAFPVKGWIYHDTPPRSEDDVYELFGPRLDMIFIDMYSTEDLMWEALKAGKIDNTDWPLSKTWYAEFTKPEYAGKVRVAYAGGEAGFYTLDFNWNNNTLLGNPPGDPPGYPNPVYPNFMHGADPQVGLAIRRAIALVFNRTKFVDIFLGAMGDLMYTPVPTYMSTYVHPEIRPGGLLEQFAYVYNRTKAIEILDNSLFKIDAGTGKRYLDKNNNGVKDPGEDAKIKFYWRSDHAGRRTVGEMLYEEMTTYLNLDVEAHPEPGADVYQHVMLDKNYHMATIGWIFIGPDPDYLYDLYHINNYWHDPESSCPNTAALNDSVLNDYAEHIKYANTPDEALEYTMLFQERFAFLAAQVPLYCNVAYKAMSWKYVGDGPDVTGPEDIYEGLNWTHVVNQMGFGVNSWWTFLNAYPYDHPTGNGHMTMRYGWKTKGYPKHLNPLYAEWYWDHEVLNKIYDSLGFRDPYDLGIWRNWLIRGFEPGTWEHPTEGTCTKLTLYLREDIKWSDGTPLTMDDVVFTLVESTPMLLAKGYAPPWYYPNVEHIVSYSVLDPYTIELLLDVKSWWAAGWILGGEYIIPKHIWKPIIETGDPSGFKPDAALVGTGPFKFVSHTPDVSVVLQKNTATFAAEPVDVSVSTGSIVHRIAPCTTVTFSISLHNLWQGGNLNVHKKVSFVYPNDTEVVVIEHDVTLAPCTPDTEPFTIHLLGGANKIKVWINITGPTGSPWFNKTVTFIFPIWATIREDINLDFIVDIEDIYTCALAYGSWPGHERWNSVCDLNLDYFVDIEDIYAIALKYGWTA